MDTATRRRSANAGSAGLEAAAQCGDVKQTEQAQRRIAIAILLLAIAVLLVPLLGSRASAPAGSTADGGTATAASAVLSARDGKSTTSAKARKAVKARDVAARSAARTAQASAVAGDWVSIMAKQDARLVNAGWTTCGTVTWSIDRKSLDGANVDREVANLAWAFDEWSKVTGLRFQYAGEIPVQYVPSTASLAAADGRTRDRHIYLTWMSAGQVSRLGSGELAIAAPSAIDASTGEVHGGRAIFESGFVNDESAQNRAEVKAVYLHELGHVLGLGHAANAANTMYPYVSDDTTLGSGDIAGARTLTRACSA